MDIKRVIITGGSGFIGTNLVEHYLSLGWQVRNLDFRPPRNPSHKSYWCDVDILQLDALAAAVQEFQPSVLLHFAARTDLDEKHDLNGYAANIQGVQNIIEAVKATPSIERLIFTSSQLVCRIGYQPKDENDYCPSTLYGESKVQGEKIVRAAGDFGPAWTLVRPTSLWGPWFDVPYKNFFQTIQKGLYIHPGGVQTHKQWGFVLNSVHQVQKLVEAPPGQMHGRTFYLADYQPILLRDFANLVQQALGARRIPTLPYWFMRLVGRAGDGMQVLGWKAPPLTSFRLHNIVTDEIQDLSPLEKAAGPLPFSTREGVRITVDWLLNHSQ